MAISFPSNPNVNDTFTVDDKTFLWTGDYWRTLSSAVTFPGIIKDADNDTKVEVEASSDEDVIRFRTAGTERLQLTSDGHLIPQANVTYDLGSASNRFRDLYLSGSSIDLGGVEITSDGTSLTMPPVSNISGDFTVDAGTLHVDSTNNWVGIGTTTPGVPFDVEGRGRFVSPNVGSTGAVIIRQPSGDATGGYLQWVDNANVYQKGAIYAGPDGNMEIAPAGGTVSITGTTDTDYLTVNNNYISPYTSRKNILYNGAMQVNQRGFTATNLTTSGYYTADRWALALSSIGAYTQSYESDGPDGFDSSLKISCTTADASPASGDYGLLYQALEGRDVQGLRKGSSSALSLTLSFWVKSNVTGTYIANLLDLDHFRQISAQYSVTSSGVWEYKTITFTGDTSGVLDNDNNGSLQVRFWFASGSGFQSGSLQTSWGTGGNNIANGQTNLAANTGNYWQITGVQLELGNAATPFEYVSFSEELNRCMRYYEKSFDYNQTPGHGVSTSAFHNNAGSLGCGGNTYGRVDYKVPKRAFPTMRFYDPGASHPVTQNWWRSYSGCSFGTAVSTGISWTARESWATGYMQYATGEAFAFEYTLEAEL